MTPVLQTARKARGPEHLDTLRTMHNLAAALSGLDKSGEARALREESLLIKKRVLGPEHPSTLSTMNSLAASRAQAGNWEKSRSLFEQVLAIELRVQPNGLGTFIVMSNLAQTYSNLGQLDRAIELQKSTAEGSIRILGMSHPFAQQSLRRLLDWSGRDRRLLEQVRPVLEQSLERARRQFGPKSSVVTSTTDSLATLLLLGRVDEASALDNVLPEDHEELGVPELGSRARLALILRQNGRLAEARRLLEQTAAEALRIGKKSPKPDESTEEVRGIAQFLLGRWPGLAPGISPAARPPASFTIEAPFRTTSPVADGRITPGEYGPGVEATFDGDTNPGRLWAWGKSRSKTPDDLSARIHTAYTDRSLFLAFQIRDQFVDAGDRISPDPTNNDSVEVFINGDHVANDLTDGAKGTREGFQLVADAGGHQNTNSLDFHDADWKVSASRTADGYIIEFEIPLALIDTRDGPEYVPAKSGSELLVNFGISDVEDTQSRQTDYGIFWAEDPALSPFMGGEDFWTVSLRLVPKPTSTPRPAASR